MEQRERRVDPGAPRGDGSGAEPGGNLERLRRSAEDMLAAGDEAIRRALSADSEAFLTASRQSGGQ